jgi:hypothetical protein
MIVEVVFGVPLRRIATVADQHPRIGRHPQESETIRNGTRLFETLHDPSAIDPGHSPRMTPTRFRHAGDPRQMFHIRGLPFGPRHKPKHSAHHDLAFVDEKTAFSPVA